MPQPALFLDRDGVINTEVEYLRHPSQLQLLPGAAQAIARVNAWHLPVIVVSNQAGIARGYFDEAQLAEIHRALDQLLWAQQHAHIDAYYFCPHHPTAGYGPYKVDCACRKPKPGLLLAAAAHHNLDLVKSYLVGDKASDIQAGQTAGCHTILVKTGYGAVEVAHARPDFVCETLAEAVHALGFLPHLHKASLRQAQSLP